MILGKKSFFYEIFMNFILLLCVPLVTILVIFVQADKTVKTQVLESASKTFTLYYEQMNEVMVDMRNTCTTIYANEKCQLYSKESIGNSGMEDMLNYDIYQILQNLRKLEYYDIFVYYYRNNKIVSGVYTTLTAENYYDSYYGKVGQEGYRAEFLEVIKTDAKRPTCNVIKNINGDKYLCMTLGVRNNKFPDSNYTICIVMKPEYIEQMHVMQNVEEDSIFMLYNEEDAVILSNNINAKFNDIDAQEYISSAEVAYDEWVDKGDYMIQVKETSKPDNKYVCIVLYDYFWNVLQNLRFWGIFGIFFCVLVSVLFAYRSAVKAYNPIGNIMELIRRTNETGFDKKKESELHYIMSFIKNNERYLKESKKTNREWCLNKLLDGKISRLENSALEKSGIIFPYRNLWICILLLEISDVEREDDLIGFVVQNVMEELGKTLGKIYFVELSKTRYALFINTDGEVGELHTMLEEGQSFLKQYYRIIMTIGCSNAYREYGEIPEAYKEAQEAVRYRFLLGTGRQIYYSDIQERIMLRNNNGESKIFMLMLDYIKGEGEDCDVEQFVERLMYVYEVNEEISMEIADFFRKEVACALSKIMALQHYSKDVCDEVVKELLSLNTLTVLQQRLCHYILELRKDDKTHKKSKNDICIKVKNYIDENYSDTQLSVAMLGKEMGMQAAHLSKLFKESYGVSLLDHIASVRIAHAKSLLREEKWSVQKVAEKTGFIDSHAFIRIFKKLEGMTPGKYKDLCEKE